MAQDDFTAWLRETWPNPPDHVLARLRHTLDVFDSELLDSRPHDEAWALTATSGVYQDQDGYRVVTGLTWGDLRLIRDALVRLWEIENEEVLVPILAIPLENFGPSPRPVIR